MSAPIDARSSESATDPRDAVGPRVVDEVPSDLDVPARIHPGWSDRFPWLVQGVTGRGAGPDAPFDLGLFGGGATGAVMARWDRLRRATGVHRVVHARQVHGAAVRLHASGPEGLAVVPATDGHVTRTPGVLLAVSIADCVPVTIVAPEPPAVALLHAGWRGAAAGILESGLAALRDRLACSPGDAHLHLGPAICGDCYEVGPEVHEALGLVPPDGPEPVDLRRLLAARAVEAGVRPDRVTVSSLCTRCGEAGLFSHRGGDGERQVAFAGIGG